MLDSPRKALRHPMQSPHVIGLRLACITNTGHCRVHNEDNFLFANKVMPQEHQSLPKSLMAEVEDGGFFCSAVFDGMGGELAGEAASYAAARALFDCTRGLDAGSMSIEQCFRAMQGAVRNVKASRRLSSIGTTVAILAARSPRMIVANLGDSPIFLMQEGNLSTLSVAHTDAKLLRELGIDRKPGITQYLGMDETDAPMEPNVVSLELQPEDRILLASDGLTDMVDEESIARAMQTSPDPQTLVEDLCSQALDAGGTDNITVIACEAVSSAAGQTR